MSTIEFNEALIDIENNLKSFALGFTRNNEDAKDLTQETMLKAIKYKNYYTDRENLMDIISVERLIDEII